MLGLTNDKSAKVCPQCGQTGRNADKIPHHTSKVNYVSMVLHCALQSLRRPNLSKSNTKYFDKIFFQDQIFFHVTKIDRNQIFFNLQSTLLFIMHFIMTPRALV